ncbi:MAG TPA: uroporphyrinogen decarboxylase family protein [Candidatus Deferrimicrobium sp.]|nr:uroporphyrinogen decarboxylase family protein [Candidatus Deferrimicrobium sp.]
MRENALAALYHEKLPKQVPMYDIRFDDYIIQTIMNTTMVDVNTEFTCLKKLGFAMITAHPLGIGKMEFYDSQRARKGVIDEWKREYVYIDGMKFYSDGKFTEADLDAQEWDANLEIRYQNIREVLKIAANEMAVIGRVGGTFERALLAVGPTRFFTYLYDRPKFIHQLLDKINDYWTKVGIREIEMGVDAILITDDLAYHSGPYLSPSHMEKFIWPTFKKRVNAFRKVPIILHSDGNIMSLLDSLIGLKVNGIHALEPTAGMDIGKVKKQFGDKLVLLGNIDCGYLLTHGTEAEVIETVKTTIAQAAPGGGYFLSTSNGVHRGVKISNLLAMCQACNKFGKYRITN